MPAGNGSYAGAGTQAQRAPRFRVETLSYIDLGQSNGGMVIGISQCGLSFQGVQPLGTGEVLPVSFKLPGMHHSLKATARIAWLNDSGKGGGLRFVDMPEDCRSLLKAWLAQRTSPRGAEEGATHLPMDVAVKQPEAPIEQGAEPAREEPGATARENSLEALRDPGPSPAPAGGLSPAAPTPAAAESYTPPAVLTAAPSVSSPAARPEPGVLRRSSFLPERLHLWLIACAVVTAIVGTGVFLTIRGRTARAVAVGSPSENSPLGLKLDRRGTDWQVSWNRNADAVLKAIGGHLSITDGQSRKDLDLEPSELRGGSILYSPVTNDLVVRLQLVVGNSDTPASELVRVMAGVSTPLPAEKPVDRFLPRFLGRFAPTGSTGIAAAPKRQNPVPEAPVLPQLKTPRRPGGSSAPQASPEAVPADFLTADPASSLSTTVTRPIDLNVRPATTPARPNPGVDSAAVIPAQLMDRRDPVLPDTARAMGISGTVTVHYQIDKIGRVNHARVVKGNPVLGMAAVSALLSWKYRPATLAGKPIESETDVDFVFKAR